MSGRFERVWEQLTSLSVVGLLAEFLMVVTGILVALGIDNWRQDREELAIAREHLRDVAVEIRGNIGTIERIAEPLEYKRQALETVLRFLSDALRGSFPAVVEELLPASLQASLNPLSFYVPRSINAPVIEDNIDPAAVLEQIVRRREEFLRLARNESAVYTANWYVQQRLKLELEDILEVLEP